MIDPEDRRLGEDVEQRPIERARRFEVVAERLLHDHPRILRDPRTAELIDDGDEQARRDREIVERPRGGSECLSELLEGPWIVVVAVDVAKPLRELGEGGGVDSSAELLEAVARAGTELLEPPARLGDADDGHLEATGFGEGLERGEDHLVGEIPGRSEEDQRVRIDSPCSRCNPPCALFVTSLDRFPPSPPQEA